MRKIILYAALGFISNRTSSQVSLPVIDSIVAKNVTQNKFSGNILIAENGTVKYNKVFGKRSATSQLPLNTSTHFPVASVTKLFTSIVILQLVQEGKLSLNDNIKSILPELAIKNGDSITIHHLLLHISGLPNEDENLFKRKLDALQAARYILSLQSNSTFGTYNYANIDYILLGLLIERKTGKAWKTNIRERLLNKLNMKETGFLETGNYPTDFAYPYSIVSGKAKNDPFLHIENFGAAACMYSTATDLLKLDQALYGDFLLSEEMKNKMFTSYPQYNYTGYAVWTYKYPFLKNQPRIMERRGGIAGANVVLVRFIDTNRTLIILSNNDQFNPDSFGDMNNLKEALMMVIGKS